MDPTDGGSLTKIILGMAGAGGFIWAAWERWIKNKVVAANSEAQVAISAAQETVYTMMTNRLESLEKEMRAVRAELAAERAHGRKLELHIFELESLMRKANLEPPDFEG